MQLMCPQLFAEYLASVRSVLWLRTVPCFSSNDSSLDKAVLWLQSTCSLDRSSPGDTNVFEQLQVCSMPRLISSSPFAPKPWCPPQGLTAGLGWPIYCSLSLLRAGESHLIHRERIMNENNKSTTAHFVDCSRSTLQMKQNLHLPSDAL